MSPAKKTTINTTFKPAITPNSGMADNFDLWSGLGLENLPEAEQTELLDNLIDTAERRWHRRLAEELVSTVDADTIKQLEQMPEDKRLEVMQAKVPNSFELLLEEVEFLKRELGVLTGLQYD